MEDALEKLLATAPPPSLNPGVHPHSDSIIQKAAPYNSFDIEIMVKLLHQEILFRNFSNGEMNTETRGIQEFRELAEKSAKIFSSRCQTITDYSAADDKAEVLIDYEALLAVDLPNGLMVGDKIQFKGKSLYGIHEGKITLIEDYS